ncbi:Rha family transcriptional regulator [Bacillus bombysepticus]|uniref:Rha family transcriptional regulator n=1 Tax=Bacillus thuringiensis serovar kumamotoensis TaxID=132267 RepID=A0A9X6JHS2_BACUK|nr:Rha family transcriptional regulator [Bacillus thuringiensis]MEC2869282.1 Rha family transcriptional regulator [Bacillus cereus]OTZ65801.1 Rha family transcriptional regulator [Bacillus thuringiensis serovar kumamtoensis]
MDQLTPVNKQPTLSSLEIAKMVGKEHKELLRDIRTYISYLDDEEMSAKLRPTNYFIESSYKDSLNRKKLCYNITKKGCELIAHKMTGKKGTLFSASYIERFHQMEQRIKKQNEIPTDPFKQIELIAAGTTNLNNRVSKLEHVIEEQLTIDFGQQRVIEKAKGRRIYFLWEQGHVDKEVHSTTRKLFGLLGKNLKDAFDVNSYRDILKKDFDEALKFIEGWRPMI